MEVGGQLEAGYSFQQDCLKVLWVQDVLVIGSDKPRGPKRYPLNRGKSQTHTSYLVPSVGPIVSVVTSHGRQNQLLKSRPVS